MSEENPLAGVKCDHTCKECGAHEIGNWAANVSKQLQAKQLCFTCDHYAHLVDISDRPDCVRVDHVHYMIGPENGPRGPGGLLRGFGGAHFKIKFKDGREVETTNLWCQGNIPHHFRDRLPDNATFEHAGA